MPARVETTSAIGTAPDACDVYDKDNIFLTDEGWVYRHYKKADKSLFWDEILVAGEVVAGATIGGVANNPVDAIGDASPTFEVGDGTQDFENSPTVGEGGGGAGGGGGGGETPPAPPATTIGSVTVGGSVSVADGTTGQTYTVDTSAATAGNLTYAWTVQGDGTINGGSTGSTVNVDFTYNTGASVVSVIVSSTDENFDGSNSNDGLTVTVAAPVPPAADVTLTLTGAEAGNSAYQTSAGNNAAITATIGQIIEIVNTSGAHPVDIVVSDGGAQVSEGTLTGAPAGNGETVRWDTTGVTAGTYYYQCTSHAAMIGTITISA